MKLIRKLKNEIKKQWKQQPVSTVVMFAALLFAVLTFFKPTTAMPVLDFFKIQAMILIYILLIGSIVLFIIKKRGMIKW